VDAPAAASISLARAARELGTAARPRARSGRLDRLASRYLHAEHDDVDHLGARAHDIVENALNASIAACD
jgi:hypothetical protein